MASDRGSQTADLGPIVAKGWIGSEVGSGMDRGDLWGPDGRRG